MVNFKSKIKFKVLNVFKSRLFSHFSDFFTNPSRENDYLVIKLVNWTFLDDRSFVIVVKKSAKLKELESHNNIKIKCMELISSDVSVLDITDTEFNALRRELPKLRSGLRLQASPKCSLLYSRILNTLNGLSQFFEVNSQQSNTKIGISHIDFDITSTKKPLKTKSVKRKSSNK